MSQQFRAYIENFVKLCRTPGRCENNLCSQLHNINIISSLVVYNVSFLILSLYISVFLSISLSSFYAIQIFSFTRTLARAYVHLCMGKLTLRLALSK